MDTKPKMKAIDWAIEKNGFYIVFLTRLSPLFPFPLLNYGFGVTKIKAWQYLLATSLGVSPTTIGYTYIGTMMRSVTDIWGSEDDDDDGTINIIWWSIGGVVTLLSIIVISIITQRAISKATRQYELQNNTLDLDEHKIVQLEEQPVLGENLPEYKDSV